MARKQRHGQNGNPTKEIDDAIQQNPVEPTVPLPRKSSMKDLSGRPSIQIADNQHNLDLTSHSKISTTHNGRHSEHSLLEQRNQRQGLGMEDMTSAFIVPDITIRNPGPFTNANPKLSTATQQVFDVIATHIGENCTVCKRVLGSGATHNHDETVKETIKIHKPTPVSERMPEANLYEEEPTMRPSQPPPIALATVIKGLKDELVHLKIQLSQDQSLYDRHDPALSKRKRKSVLSKIEKLIQAVDSKSDQIYALYDVLEGQKADGHEISEEEVEMTLQSVGIDLAGLGLRGGDLFKEDEKKEQRPAWDLDSSDESGEDLPWEGFEVTGDITRRSGESRRRSWGA
ncbi:hypothetical protein MMC13_000410 [Lambiella insularis]|nr:hypothetical protein [Lambiella insularis]